MLGAGKGSASIGCNEARISSGSKEDLDCLHMAIYTRCHECSRAARFQMLFIYANLLYIVYVIFLFRFGFINPLLLRLLIISLGGPQ